MLDIVIAFRMFDNCTSNSYPSEKPTYHNVEGLPDLFWSLACNNETILLAEHPGVGALRNWHCATGTVRLEL